MLLQVRHNIEVAHRLIYPKGKCENIHGHSMWVTLTLDTFVDGDGMGDSLDFGEIKKFFRSHLDTRYDHHLLLCGDDELLQKVELPGVTILDKNPTTENIAIEIFRTMDEEFGDVKAVKVDETSVNAALTTRGDVYPL